MRFLFECEDKVLLPRAYELIELLHGFFDKMKKVELPDAEAAGTDRKSLSQTVLKNMMVHFPEETSAVLAKLWVLEDDETAPNALKTMTAFLQSREALDFFTCALPFLARLSGGR